MSGRASSLEPGNPVSDRPGGSKASPTGKASFPLVSPHLHLLLDKKPKQAEADERVKVVPLCQFHLGLLRTTKNVLWNLSSTCTHPIASPLLSASSATFTQRAARPSSFRQSKHLLETHPYLCSAFLCPPLIGKNLKLGIIFF